MELDTALQWAGNRHNGVLITIRADGRPQSSDISFSVDDGSFLISVTEDRAKARNLRRDPRAVLHITDPANWSYLSFDGTAELSPTAAASDDETVDRLAPQLVIIVHSWKDQEFINFDGPANAVAERFSTASGLPLKASVEFAPTPGSLGSYVGRDRGIPVLTIEFRKGSDPEKDWLRIREALLQAFRGD